MARQAVGLFQVAIHEIQRLGILGRYFFNSLLEQISCTLELGSSLLSMQQKIRSEMTHALDHEFEWVGKEDDLHIVP